MHLIIHEREHTALLSGSQLTLKLPIAKNLIQNGVGLLLRKSLGKREGIVLKSRIISTVGMAFPIAIAAFNDLGSLVAEPTIAHPGRLFLCPRSTCYVAEFHHEALGESPPKCNRLHFIPRQVLAQCKRKPRSSNIFCVEGSVPTLLVTSLTLFPALSLTALGCTIFLMLIFR